MSSGRGMQDSWNDVPRSGKDGTFELRLRPGSYDVFVRAEGYADTVRHDVVVAESSEPLQLRLEPGLSIAGRVVEADGAPIAGVQVSTWNDGAPRDSVTDENGVFELAGLPNRAVSLNAYDDGGSVNEDRSVRPPQHDYIIKVTPFVTLSGRVVEKDGGAPITDFDVTIAAQQTTGGAGFFPPMEVPVHDAEGKFSISRVPARASEVRIEAAGHVGAKKTLQLQLEKESAPVTIALARGIRIRGRVTDEDGHPIEQALINFDQKAGTINQWSNRPKFTENDGSYTMDGVPVAEDGVLVVRREGFRPFRKAVKTADQDLSIDVQLARGLRLTGHVTSDGGAPVAGADVSLNSGTADQGWGRAVTDDQGTFRVDALSAGTYRLSVNRKGFVTRTEENLDPSKTPEITLQLERGATISGHITGLSAAELPDVTIMVRGQGTYARAKAGPSGDYRIDGAPLGNVTVRASVYGDQMRVSEPVTLDISGSGDFRADLEFRRGLVLSGHVRRNGLPLTTGRVQFLPKAAPARSGGSVIHADGSYEIAGLAEGLYDVMISEESGSALYKAPQSVTRSDTLDIDIVPLVLRGRVVDAETNAGLANVEIHAEQAGSGSDTWGSPSTESDADGSFTLSNLTAGQYQLRASRPSYGAVTQSVQLRGAGDPNVEMRMARSEGLVLVITDSRDGKRVAANIRLTDAAGATVYEGRGSSQSDGSTLVPVAPGTYHATIGNWMLASVAMTLQSPGRREVVLTPGGSLVIRSQGSANRRARLRTADGAIAPYAAWNPMQELTVLVGTSTLEHLASGHYTLELLDSGGAVTNKVPFDITEGGSTKIDL